VPPPADKAHLGACQLWAGAHNRFGYALFSRGPGYSQHATHAAYRLYTGEEKPAGLEMLHLCNVPGCVEPAHLRPDTHRANMQQLHADRRARQATPTSP
jgi:hypothetical protein